MNWISRMGLGVAMEVVIALFFGWSLLLILTLLMFALGKRSDVSSEAQPTPFPPLNSRPILTEPRRNPSTPRTGEVQVESTPPLMRRVVRPR